MRMVSVTTALLPAAAAPQLVVSRRRPLSVKLLPRKVWTDHPIGRTLQMDGPSAWTDHPSGKDHPPACRRRPSVTPSVRPSVCPSVTDHSSGRACRGGGEEEEMAEVVMEAAGKEV